LLRRARFEEIAIDAPEQDEAIVPGVMLDEEDYEFAGGSEPDAGQNSADEEDGAAEERGHNEITSHQTRVDIFCKQLLDLKVDTNSSQRAIMQFVDTVVHCFGGLLPLEVVDSLPVSWKALENPFKKSYSEVWKLDACSRDCMVYSPEMRDLLRCITCGTSRRYVHAAYAPTYCSNY
jgi:hypothetical protein